MSKTRSEKMIGEFQADAFRLAAAIVMICGFGIIAYQCYYWLKYAVWYEYSLLYVYNWINPNYLDSWLYNPDSRLGLNIPDSWLGLQKIIVWVLDFVPLSFVIIGIGSIIMTIGFEYAEEIEETENVVESSDDEGDEE